MKRVPDKGRLQSSAAAGAFARLLELPSPPFDRMLDLYGGIGDDDLRREVSVTERLVPSARASFLDVLCGEAGDRLAAAIRLAGLMRREPRFRVAFRGLFPCGHEGADECLLRSLQAYDDHSDAEVFQMAAASDRRHLRQLGVKILIERDQWRRLVPNLATEDERTHAILSGLLEIPAPRPPEAIDAIKQHWHTYENQNLQMMALEILGDLGQARSHDLARAIATAERGIRDRGDKRDLLLSMLASGPPSADIDQALTRIESEFREAKDQDEFQRSIASAIRRRKRYSESPEATHAV